MGAVANNGKGVSGVAWKVKILGGAAFTCSARSAGCKLGLACLVGRAVGATVKQLACVALLARQAGGAGWGEPAPCKASSLQGQLPAARPRPCGDGLRLLNWPPSKVKPAAPAVPAAPGAACKFMDKSGVGYASGAIQCIQYCVSNKAQIIQVGVGSFIRHPFLHPFPSPSLVGLDLRPPGKRGLLRTPPQTR